MSHLTGLLAMLVERAHILAAHHPSGLILIAPMSAQTFVATNTKTGSILGTVVDTTDDTIPGATVVLQGPAAIRLTVVTKDDGAFVFHDVPPEPPIRSLSPLKDLQSGTRPLQSNPARIRLFRKSNFAFWLCSERSP